MSSIHNVILVIALGAQWICQGIKIDPSGQKKVFLPLPRTTPLPPQLAYYVQGARSSDSVHNNKNEHFGKSALPSNGGVITVIDAPYSKKTIPSRLQNSNFGFVRNHKYSENPSSNEPQIYQPYVNDPASYNFQQYYGQQNPDSIVRATPPPERRPNRTPPPPSKKVTFQVNQLERNYRAQQDFERRNRDPHFRSQAIRQVQSPSLTTEAPQNHKVLRNNIRQLKKTQREHFNIDEDEHPAHQSFSDAGDDDIEQITQNYSNDYNYKNGDKFNDEELQDDRLIKGYGQYNGPSSNYEKSEPKFTNFYDEIDEAAKYISHANFVTPTSYQNYNNDHEDNSETPYHSSNQNYDHGQSDQPSYTYKQENNDDDADQLPFNPYKTENIDSYGRKQYITNEEVKQFDKYLRSIPRYVGPKKKKQRLELEDRSDQGDRLDTGTDFVPYKMLASVRHSERYEQQPKDLSNPLLKERILEKGGHVVYTEQGYEDKQFDHGNEEKFANIKHRRRRHVSEDKFPFYYSSTRNIPRHSAIRYAENSGQLHNAKAPFYNNKRKLCKDVVFDDKNVNDKEIDFKSKRRLVGLGDKIDCLKERLFGIEPLNNPIFQEQFVDETVPLVKNRRTRNSFDQEPYSTLVNVFDDVTSNIEKSSKADNDPTESESKIDYVVFPPYVDLANSKLKSDNTSVLDIIQHEIFNQTKPPVVILMNEKSFSQMSNKTSKAKLLSYLKYPQSDGTEVFIFDISKFIPRLSLPVNDDYYDSEENMQTTVSPDISNSQKKLKKKKSKKRRNQKKSLDSYKYSPDRHTDVVGDGVHLAKIPYLLPGTYDLHTQGKIYG